MIMVQQPVGEMNVTTSPSTLKKKAKDILRLTEELSVSDLEQPKADRAKKVVESVAALSHEGKAATMPKKTQGKGHDVTVMVNHSKVIKNSGTLPPLSPMQTTGYNAIHFGQCTVTTFNLDK